MSAIFIVLTVTVGVLILGAWLSGHWEKFWHERMVEDLMRLDQSGVPLSWEVFLRLPRRHRQFLIISKTPSFLREELNRNTGNRTGCEVVVKM